MWRGAMQLMMRGKTWHLRRRVPARFAPVEPRREVWVSLKTDSRQQAAKKAPAVWDSLVAGWEAQLAGRSEDGAARLETARAIAASHGLTYKPVRDLEDLPLEELLARVEVLQRRDGTVDTAAAPALLGTVDVPSMTVSEALAEYWALTPDRVRGKSADQKRRWENPRKKAVRNFIDVVGDRPVATFTRADFLDFRSWWLERIAEENLTPNSANKDLIHLADVLRTVDELKGLGLDLPLHKLTLKEGDKAERVPFSDGWIREKLLAEGALAGINDEARAILVGMINTGYRPSEAAGLTAGRIRLDHEVPHLVIASDETRQIKNKTSRREIPLTGVSLEVFRAFPSGFPHYREKPANLSATVNKYLRENGLMESESHVMYSLRHSFEDRMLRGRIDERIRRELMGHSLGRQKYGQGGGLAFKAGELARIAIEGAFP
jgi:integrase